MAGYIKSHSNYRLQTRHQIVDGGVILERDISTVGGINTFPTGQATVYQSGNFVMVVNNGSPIARHVNKGSWLPSYDGSDTWDSESIKSHESDVRGSVENRIMLKNDFMDLRSFAYYGSLSELVENTIYTILREFPYEIYLGDSSSGISATTYDAYNPGGVDIITKNDPSTERNKILGHFSNGGYLNYEIYEDGSQDGPFQISSWDVSSGYTDNCTAYRENPSFPLAATINISYAKTNNVSIFSNEEYCTIYALYSKDGSIFYNWEKSNKPCIHIRPKKSLGFYSSFIDKLDLFGKCLMGVYSGTKNVSRFEVLNNDSNTSSKTLRVFTLPTGEGDYNIATHGMSLERYVNELGKIALSYDDYYTDNMYRMMTHESLKNLDWTKGFNGDDGSGHSQYVKTGEKFASVIRLMGYVFDNEKSYIDSIGNVNTITYSDRSNLSDYFLSDSLNDDGWVVTTIYPYKLTLTQGGEDVTDNADYTYSGQTSGIYRRSFSEITDLGEIKPYNTIGGACCYVCNPSLSGMTEYRIDDYSGQTYQVVSGNVYNVITDYHSDDAINVPDINNEFEKRLRINSRFILRKKGTIEGIESLLSIFGMRSKRWVDAHKQSYSGTTKPDYDIEEFSTIAPYIVDGSDGVHEHRIDWYNRCKTIPYYTGGRIETQYIPYQGIPVAYRDVGNERRLYPYFDGYGVYDGGMYYQMNGGWLSYFPYRFGTGNEVLSGSTNNVETMRDVMLVSNIDELVSQPRSNLYSGMVCYVNDISGEFAIIDGTVYHLETDSSGMKYFVVNVYGSSVTIGGELYQNTICVSDSTSGTTFYDLGIYEDGYPIRIYYKGDREDAFTIKEYLYEDPSNPYTLRPESTLVFLEGNYDGADNNTHYFTLVDIDGYGKIGRYFWRQVKNDENLFRMVDSVIDNYNGNNPHFGGFDYDNGMEYLERFKKLFKYPLEKGLFNTSCFPNISEALIDIESIGFDVNGVLTKDRKLHSFADLYDSGGTESKYDMDVSASLCERVQEYAEIIQGHSSSRFDGVPSHIINTKNIRITFYLTDSSYYSKSSQEQIKYIQSKVMPYLEQVIPSTSIVEIRFIRSTGERHETYTEDGWHNSNPWLPQENW